MVYKKQKSLKTILQEFLDKEAVQGKPLLLGFSGGPDSLALLHLLLDYRQRHSLDLHIAHVDHGWRKESGQEALFLKEMAEQLGLPFHLKQLMFEDLLGNLEAASREARLQFFSSLYQQLGCQALVLGHHADDQAETILKGILESKSLPYLAGMQLVSDLYGMKIWRPFLEVPKAVIIDWLDNSGLTPLEDCTNLDARFLRARFRTRIIPMLSEEFGKEVRGALCRLGNEAVEIRSHLEASVNPILAKEVKGKLGSYLDLNSAISRSPWELKYLLRKFCAGHGFFLSHDSIELAVSLLQSKAANKQILAGQRKIYIDRGKLFIPQQIGLLPEGKLPLDLEGMHCGSWKITVSHEKDYRQTERFPSWREGWIGRFTAMVPAADDYFIGSGMDAVNSDCIHEQWTNHKVPAFLRQTVPVLWKNNSIVYEFLTGKPVLKRTSFQSYFKITFDFLPLACPSN